MKAIHNYARLKPPLDSVVLYPKDTEKWKQFTTVIICTFIKCKLFCIPKILKNESNSQQPECLVSVVSSCFVSQRYWKMKAIHNYILGYFIFRCVVLYPKDTEKWKQFTTLRLPQDGECMLFCIPKILKNESNSQLQISGRSKRTGCFVSQRYWKMKAIHN